MESCELPSRLAQCTQHNSQYKGEPIQQRLSEASNRWTPPHPWPPYSVVVRAEASKTNRSKPSHRDGNYHFTCMLMINKLPSVVWVFKMADAEHRFSSLGLLAPYMQYNSQDKGETRSPTQLITHTIDACMLRAEMLRAACMRVARCTLHTICRVLGALCMLSAQCCDGMCMLHELHTPCFAAS